MHIYPAVPIKPYCQHASARHGIAVAVAGWMVIGKTMVTKRLTLFMSIPFYDEALVSEGFSSQGDTWQVRVKIK